MFSFAFFSHLIFNIHATFNKKLFHFFIRHKLSSVSLINPFLYFLGNPRLMAGLIPCKTFPNRIDNEILSLLVWNTGKIFFKGFWNLQ